MQQLGLNSQQQQEAQRAFREGKAADFPLTEQLQSLRQALRWRPDLLQMFLEIQISVAYVDAKLSSAEEKVLQQIANALAISSLRLQHFIRAIRGRSEIFAATFIGKTGSKFA